jgi:diguanylate cyclase (GGDEF)-like protein
MAAARKAGTGPAEIQGVRISTRYGLIGILVGVFAPAALLLYGVATRQTFDPVWSSAAFAAGGTVVFALVGRMIGRRDEILLARNRELAELSDQLRALSTIDALTGIHNRRSFDERLDMELARTQRYGAPCSLVMIDLDRFKIANDRHGHQAGDQVLRHVAALLDAEKRSGDLIARYGGEELAAILPHTEAADARAWAERVRARIEAEPTRWQDTALRVTASLGVAAAPPHEETPAALVAAADRALYAAKQQGRNTVVVDEGSRRADWARSAS